MTWSESDLAMLLRTKPAVRVASGLTPPVSATPERVFQDQVVRLARSYGWLVYHTYNSRRSAPGYPDVTLAKPGHPLYLAELKTSRGKLRHEQEVWLNVLQRLTQVEARLWRPEDWDAIVLALTAPSS